MPFAGPFALGTNPDVPGTGQGFIPGQPGGFSPIEVQNREAALRAAYPTISSFTEYGGQPLPGGSPTTQSLGFQFAGPDLFAGQSGSTVDTLLANAPKPIEGATKATPESITAQTAGVTTPSGTAVQTGMAGPARPTTDMPMAPPMSLGGGLGGGGTSDAGGGNISGIISASEGGRAGNITQSTLGDLAASTSPLPGISPISLAHAGDLAANAMGFPDASMNPGGVFPGIHGPETALAGPRAGLGQNTGLFGAGPTSTMPPPTDTTPTTAPPVQDLTIPLQDLNVPAVSTAPSPAAANVGTPDAGVAGGPAGTGPSGGTAGSAAGGPGGPSGGSAGSGTGGNAGGEGVGGDFHSGGRIPGQRNHEVQRTLLPGEFVVNPYAAAKYRQVLEHINNEGRKMAAQHGDTKSAVPSPGTAHAGDYIGLPTANVNANPDFSGNLFQEQWRNRLTGGDLSSSAMPANQVSAPNADTSNVGAMEAMEAQRAGREQQSQVMQSLDQGRARSTQPSGGAGKGSAATETVICTELRRQGLMDDETWKRDRAFGETLPVATRLGYVYWGAPLARLMQRSPLTTRIVAAIARPWARYMAFGDSRLGALIMALGMPLCTLLGMVLLRRTRA